jgi:hypothetical protein
MFRSGCIRSFRADLLRTLPTMVSRVMGVVARAECDQS